VPRFASPEELASYRESLRAARDPQQPVVALCDGPGCKACNCAEVFAMFEKALRAADLQDQVRLMRTGCQGFCEQAPLVVIRPQGIFYGKLRPEDVHEVVMKTLLKGEPVERLLYRHPDTGEVIEKEEDIPFYKAQKRILFANMGLIEPTSIDDYIVLDGYAGLAKALTLSPEAIIQEVLDSGLRGRGGGGFLTGRKWQYCRRMPGDVKYIICNADEGDPGAYMDRGLLEGNPHSVIEGMLIGAYAIGATAGYAYVRHEYPLAVRNLKIALQQAEEHGLIGDNILGTGFSFHLKIIKGGGAFVCGEETSLMASVEGRAGEPRPRPPYPAESGLWGKPTNINNVETWANIPYIIRRGAKWFASIGSPNNTGTKVFSLVGKIRNTGLVEVPMGITIREVLFDIGGGMKDRKFRAVQTGGPSGGAILVEKATGLERRSVDRDGAMGTRGLLPESFLDLPVDFDSLWEFTDERGVRHRLHSMMGSGGLIVMDEGTCMVDMARYYMNFLREESCGKCTPCREGIRRMLEILDRICDGKGRPEDLDLLWELGEVLEDTSLCGLGSTAANPVLSTLKFFREEYEAHILEGWCPAGVCRELCLFGIIADKCTGCTICARRCPVEAIRGEAKQPHVIDTAKCIKCGICFDVCKFDAVTSAAHRLAGAAREG